MKRRKKRGKPAAIVTVGNVGVKIYKRTRQTITGDTRDVFEIADYTSGVRRLRGFKSLALAKTDAERIARQLSCGEATAASMLASEAIAYGRAMEILRPTGVSLELAVSTYAKAVELLGGDHVIEAARFYKRRRADKVEHRKVADVVAEMLAAKEAKGKSGRYIADLRARLTRFADSFAVDISSVTTPDVQRWLDGLKVSPQTAKNFRTVLNTLFSFAESRGYIFKGGNPVQDTEAISTNGGSAIEIFTPQEIDALLKAAPPEFMPVIALGAFAGLRAAEAERIEWRDIDLVGGFVHVGADKAKTRSRRLVPILPNLAQWLALSTKRTGKVWKGTPEDIRDLRAATVKASGVAWKDNGLRHSFCSYRLADTQNAAQVALEAGNSAEMIFKHYRELVKPEAAKAWFAVAPNQPENVIQVAKANP
ncbi:MAG: hypothetical protein AB1813_25155 [Verrucomicrobiota bacterium]